MILSDNLNFLEYFETTTLDYVKEKIVSVWTNQVTHMENTATKRIQIQTYFSQCIIVLEHKFTNKALYFQFTGNISRVRFNFVYHEITRVEKIIPNNFN